MITKQQLAKYEMFREEGLDLIKGLGLSEAETIAVEIRFSAFVQQLVSEQNSLLVPMPVPTPTIAPVPAPVPPTTPVFDQSQVF